VIAWLNAGAFAGVALLVGPVLIHLLLRHRVQRIRFPSLRFVRASPTATVRVRLPSDLLLLLLRLAIVALAVFALAQPLILIPARIAAWNGRMARVILIDASESMNPWAPAAAQIARAEAQSASFTFEVRDGDLGSGLRKAVAALSSAFPARREIVVISDFQWGALRPQDLDVVPPEVGLRLIQVGNPQAARRLQGLDLFRVGPAAHQQFQLTTEETGFPTLVGGPKIDGLVFLARPTDAAAVQTLQRTVAAAGTPAPWSREPIAIALEGADLPPAVRAPDVEWMLGTLLRLGTDKELAAVCATSEAEAPQDRREPWRVVFRDRRGHPLVTAAASATALLLDVAAPPSAFLSAAVVRGALRARWGLPARPEEEIRRMAGTTLASLTRAPAPVERSTRHPQSESDARGCWLLVLALLGIEGIVRRERRVPSPEVRADAA
jgi:hypothetical protein